MNLRGSSFRHSVPVVFALIFASACASTPTLDDQRKKATEAGITDVVFTDSLPEPNYNNFLEMPKLPPVKKGDTLIVRIAGFDDMSGQYLVDRAGNIDMPLIGNVSAAGKDPYDLQDEITSRYADGFVQDPRVSLDVSTRLLGRAVIDGAVSDPQVIDMDRFLKLSEVIAMAGGLSDIADDQEVYIVRQVEGKAHVSLINYEGIRRFGGDDPQIAPGDIIFVEQDSAQIYFETFLQTFPIGLAVATLATR